ncbi:MAG: prephenate dehydratase [Erysipelotrichaceae bacterium]|nr:prephenate dehydratase [Erysipelotrichaceae bacterium]
MKVGYQGVNGTFSEIAVNEYFKGQNYKTFNYNNFIDILKDVERGVIEYALIPVENTTTGIISRTYDLLKDYDVFVVGEINIQIREQLLGIKESKIEDIKEVYSHPEALGQCTSLFSQYNYMKPIAYQDTAKSAEYIKLQNDKTKAALASVLAAKHYDLKILKADVQDNKNNITRFFCITNKQVVNCDADKISTMFILKHEVGSLFKLLEVFYKNNVNLLKLESRPIKDKTFEYCFYLDFNGNLNDDNVKNVLESIEDNCISYKILGCYKRANI